MRGEAVTSGRGQGGQGPLGALAAGQAAGGAEGRLRSLLEAAD